MLNTVYIVIIRKRIVNSSFSFELSSLWIVAKCLVNLTNDNTARLQHMRIQASLGWLDCWG